MCDKQLVKIVWNIGYVCTVLYQVQSVQKLCRLYIFRLFYKYSVLLFINVTILPVIYNLQKKWEMYPTCLICCQSIIVGCSHLKITLDGYVMGTVRKIIFLFTINYKIPFIFSRSFQEKRIFIHFGRRRLSSVLIV